MKNGSNICSIHLLSGHLHGCEGKGRGETIGLLGWQQCRGMTCDSCDSTRGWGGAGRQATCCAPWSNYATQPPCQTQQLDSSHSEDSIDLLSGGPVALPYNPAPSKPPHTPATYSPANQLAIHSSANQPLKFRLWHSGKEKGQQGRVLNTPTGGEADLITSWEWLWWSSCPDLSSGIHLRLP